MCLCIREAKKSALHISLVGRHHQNEKKHNSLISLFVGFQVSVSLKVVGGDMTVFKTKLVKVIFFMLNGISTFGCYLIPKPSLEKNSSSTILPITGVYCG